jgi:hypothetical protein
MEKSALRMLHSPARKIALPVVIDPWQSFSLNNSSFFFNKQQAKSDSPVLAMRLAQDRLKLWNSS